MGKTSVFEGKVQFLYFLCTVRKSFEKNRSSLCCQPPFSVFISTVGQLFKSDVKRCQNPIGSTANGVCLSRAMCWLTACSFGLTWVGYFLLLLQHLLQTWLWLFSTVVAKHLNKKLKKKEKKKLVLKILVTPPLNICWAYKLQFANLLFYYTVKGKCDSCECMWGWPHLSFQFKSQQRKHCLKLTRKDQTGQSTCKVTWVDCCWLPWISNEDSFIVVYVLLARKKSPWKSTITSDNTGLH